MNHRADELPSELMDAAGEWFMRRQGGLTPSEEGELAGWLAADARHSRALEEFSRTWRRLNEPRENGWAGLALQSLAERRARRVRRRIRLAGTAAAMVAVALFALTFPRRRAEPFGTNWPKSIAIRPDRQALSDGSSVELNAGARIVVKFTAAERSVELLEGEALFSVAKDATRPFVVTAHGVAVRAVGTAFSVNRGGTAVEVLVTEGTVAVDRGAGAHDASPGSAPATARVGAGRRVTVPLAQAAGTELSSVAVTPVQIDASLAWRRKRIAFTETPLADVLKLFNDQNRVSLEAADRATAQLEVSGIFWANDCEAFVRMVETGLNLVSERDGDRVILRRR